jgi:hypothetical protein
VLLGCDAAVAVLLDYLLQITAFVALLTLDFRRTESGRVDCLPCIPVGSDDPNEQSAGKIMIFCVFVSTNLMSFFCSVCYSFLL